MADFNKPTVDSHYTQFPNEIRAAISAALSFLDGGSHINIPMKAKRWNPTSKIFEEYSGTQWVPMATEYKLPVDYNALRNKPVPSSLTNSSSETTFANSKAVKIVHDLANSKQNPATTLAGYGITNFKIETANGNANNYKTDGNYYFASGKNLPGVGAWHIEVVSGGAANAIRQIARKANDSEVKERFFNGSSWSEWKKTGSDGVPVGSIIGFHKNITPKGFLRAIGGTFNQATYPDLYVANGNSNVLPNLNQTDIGMTAFFAVDQIPDGWIEFDSIRTTVTQQSYPELYQHLIAKYGSISNVPLADDRFIRNAGNGLSVGLTQGDAIRNITGYFEFRTYNTSEIVLTDGVFNVENGKRSSYTGNTNISSNHPKFKFDASRQVPTADENRPRSIVLKLCIKAKDKFNDVVFWIKAFGEITNAGTLDAGTLAQNIQQLSADKADKNHTHSYIDITDFKNGVANSYQHIFQENGWRKSADGFIEQWGKILLNPGSGGSTDNPVNFPIAFPNKVLNVVMSYAVMTDKRISQDPVLTTLTNTSMTIRQQSDRNVTVFWRAIGK